MKGWSWVAAFAVALAILPGDLRYRLKCYAIFPILGNAGMVAQMQHQDGHYYLAPFVNPPEQIAIARSDGAQRISSSPATQSRGHTMRC